MLPEPMDRSMWMELAVHQELYVDECAVVVVDDDDDSWHYQQSYDDE